MRGAWSLPGGVLEVGETVKEGVAREVREETGCEVLPIELIDAIDRIVYDSSGAVEYHYVLLEWLCDLSCSTMAGTPQPVAGTDAQDVRWAPLHALHEFALEETMLRMIFRAADRVAELRR